MQQRVYCTREVIGLATGGGLRSSTPLLAGDAWVGTSFWRLFGPAHGVYQEISLCKPWRPLRPKQFKGAPPSPPHTLQRWTETLVRRLCGSRLSKSLRYLLSRSQYGAPKQQGCRTSSRDRLEPNLRYARSLIGQVSFPTSRCGQQLRSGAARGGSQIPHMHTSAQNHFVESSKDNDVKQF